MRSFKFRIVSKDLESDSIVDYHRLKHITQWVEGSSPFSPSITENKWASSSVGLEQLINRLRLSTYESSQQLKGVAGILATPLPKHEIMPFGEQHQFLRTAMW